MLGCGIDGLYHFREGERHTPGLKRFLLVADERAKEDQG
jgi:hypothetical protein